jgi:hypothetical protein
MDFTKLYYQKLISDSSTYLKLTPDKIASVQILKEFLLAVDNYEYAINEMKKVTEVSKMAIHLSDIFHYCNYPAINFLELSNKYKEQLQIIIKDIENLQLSTDAIKLKGILDSITSTIKKLEPNKQPKKEEVTSNTANELEENKKLKEEFILSDDDEEENSYEFYVKTVLSPIRELDGFLQRLEFYETPYDEMDKYQQTIEKNALHSQKYGFELIANMHFYFSGALKHIMEHRLIVDKDVIEKMRACLIVIAALVRQKDVDITNYLNKADKLGKLIQNIKG